MSRRHIPYLRFHRHIIREVNLPETDDLLVMSKGLGMRRIICALLKAYDSKENLIIIVNATPTDEAGIGDELGTMGVRDPGLRVLNYATTGAQRTELYNKGGLFSVTSQILVVDLLKNIIPTKLITGIVVLHAERVTKTSQEAFAIRSYRKVNHTGFTKAFSDEPEAFAFGMSPLRDTLMNLNMRNVHFWPRFHELVKDTLASRKADVVELYQPLTPAMAEIQQAILECMEAMIIELKRNHTLNLDLEDLNVQNALFKSFDATVRKQLGPVWHKVGYKTRKYVADLTQLRQLLSYLLEYDCVHFASYIETIVFANKLAVEQAKKTGNQKNANTTDWLSAKPAGILVQKAMERMYIKRGNPVARSQDAGEDEDELEALREMEAGPGPSTTRARTQRLSAIEAEETRLKKRLPPGSEIVLEELPKWKLLADVLEEIEQTLALEGEEVIDITAPGNNTILVMTTTDRTCLQLREYLSTMQRVDPATGKSTGNRAGRKLMLRRLRNHLNWKAGMDQMRSGYNRSGFDEVVPPGGEVEKETRQPLDKDFRDRRPINRRRKRGGKTGDFRGPSTPGNMAEYVLHGPAISEDAQMQWAVEESSREQQEIMDEAARAFSSEHGPLRSLDPLNSTSESIDADASLIDQDELTFEELDAMQRVDDWDEHYGLVAPEELIIVRHYGGDDDEVMLQELRPRFVVLYDPDQAFIRRLEVYRTSNPGLALRVYQIMYQASSEEERYLGALSKESDAFSRLIRQRGTMVIPIHGDPRHPMRDPITRAKTTYSTRNAGGGGADEPSIVVVDIREFRASLASLLDAAGIVVIPETLSVGDYVINPSMCIERKSLSDLQSSFANGRLHEQVEKMGRHYATPILLIEFEEHKFSLMTREDAKAHGKGKDTTDDGHDPYYLQGRLALLALNFPRLRIIWSSSPQESVAIITDLKLNHPEPDPSRAAAIGASADDTDDSAAPAAFNLLPQEMLRALPGVTGNNWRYIASHVRGIKELVAMDEKEMGLLMGKDNGKACFEFLHKDGRLVPRSRH